MANKIKCLLGHVHYNIRQTTKKHNISSFDIDEDAFDGFQE